MTGDLVFLDVNVPMYAAGGPHRYKIPCSQIMKAIAKGSLAVAIDTEIIQEILYRFGAIRQWEIAVSMASDVLTLATKTYPVTEEDMRRTVDLFGHYARKGATARDLIHAAVMKNNQLADIITVDDHFDVIEGIQRIDPVDIATSLAC